ncbi:MAG: hypothetical protein R3345_06755, partial [Fulvivirga sp.]|nr:hypothetical protein [Fulvivirga sp.]
MRFDWSSLFLFNGVILCLAGIVVILAYGRANAMVRVFAGLLFLSIAIILLERIVRFSSLYFEYPQLLFLSGPFLFLIYPLTYLFQRYLIKMQRYWYLHLIIPLASVLFLPSYQMSGAQKLSMFSKGSEDPWWFTLCYFLYALGYILFIYRNYFQQHYIFSSQYADARVDESRAMNRFIALGSSTFICIPLAFTTGYLQFNEAMLTAMNKLLFVIFSLNPLFLLFALINYRDISLLNTTTITKEVVNESTEDDDLKWSFLTEYMENNAPYLNPSLTLVELSKLTGIGRSELSGLINSKYDNNFYEFVNQYRLVHLV